MSNPRPLGRIVHHDPRSLAYAAPRLPAGVTRVSVRHTRIAPVFDQGDLGSCTGNACLGAIGTNPMWADLTADGGQIPDLTEATAVKLYSAATALDNVAGTYPPDDTGSSGLAVAKAAVKAGWLSGYTHALSLDAALDALVTTPVIIGIDWYDSFDTPDVNGLIAIGATATIRGGHELVLDELNVERQLVGGTNSWGTSWGQNGRFYMSWHTLGRLLAADGDATILVPVTQPAPTPTPGAATFLVSPQVMARVAHLAVHAQVTTDAWLEHHLRTYLKMPAVTP